MGNHNYEEELKKDSQLQSLKQEIDYKNQQLSEMEHKLNDTNATVRKLIIGLTDKVMESDRRLVDFEHKYHELERMYNEKSSTVRQLMNEKSRLFEKYIGEISKERSINKELLHEMKCHKRELEQQQTKELEECKAQHDLESRSLMDQIEKLKGKLQNQYFTESDSTLNDEIRALSKQLKDKTEELQGFESLNRVLIVKELISRQELLDARKESISGLQNVLHSRSTLVIRRMGEIDKKAFDRMCSEKYSDGDWEGTSAELCSKWQEHVNDSSWHPFKHVENGGKPQVIINDEDEKLKKLRNDHGEVVYKAVTNALLELHNYNASGGSTVAELWNVKEGRRATMKEIIQYIIKQLKNHKRKRKLR